MVGRDTARAQYIKVNTQPMEINFEVSKKEIGQIGRCVTKSVWSQPENRRIKYILQTLNLIFWIPIGFFAAWSFSKSEEFGSLILYGMVLVMGVMYLYRFIEKKLINLLPNDPGPSLGPLKLTADEQGITVAGTGSKTITEWGGVKQIVRISDYILIFIDRQMAHYVPVSAFENENKVAEFINELESFRKSHTT